MPLYHVFLLTVLFPLHFINLNPVHLFFKAKSNPTSCMKQSQTAITLDDLSLPLLKPQQTQFLVLGGNSV